MSIRPSLDPRALVALVLAAAAVASWSADAFDLRAERERERIKKERQRVEATYNAQVRRCQQQFVVTSCIEDARAQRRESLDRLTQQQSVLDDALRKQRAAERLEKLKDKQLEAARRREQPAQPTRVVQRAGSSASAASSAHPHVPPVPHGESLTPQQRSHNEAAYKLRQADAVKHRQEVEQRNAARAAEHKPSPSLPLPSASEAASK